MLKDEVTIIVPVHYRTAHRVLDYYRDVQVDILIADSRNSPLEYDKEHRNVRCFHYEGCSFPEKMADVIQYVNTPYAVMCPDDDFIVPSAIDRCVAFLETNPDYASAQGNYVQFSNTEEEVEVWRLYPNIAGYDINRPTAAERIKQHMDHPMHVIYAVHRSTHLKYFFQEINSHFTNPNLGEVGLGLISSINGGHKVLPMFYTARDSFQYPVKPYEPNFPEMATDPELMTEYETFLSLVTTYFCQQTGSTQAAGRRSVEQAMALYMHKVPPRLKSKVLKCLMPFVPGKLRAFRRKLIRDRFLFLDEESKREWETIESLIVRHRAVSW